MWLVWLLIPMHDSIKSALQSALEKSEHVSTTLILQFQKQTKEIIITWTDISRATRPLYCQANEEHHQNIEAKIKTQPIVGLKTNKTAQCLTDAINGIHNNSDFISTPEQIPQKEKFTKHHVEEIAYCCQHDRTPYKAAITKRSPGREYAWVLGRSWLNSSLLCSASEQ